MANIYSIARAGGLQVDLVDVGAAVSAIRVPAGAESIDVIAQGMCTADYDDNRNFCGVTVGRYANRIGNAHLSVDGRDSALSVNDAYGKHCLHGGSAGFSKARWSIVQHSDNAITFGHVSPDGDQGFPGELQTSVRYSLADADSLAIEYVANTSAPTVVNLTNHCYFNLDGDGGIEHHVVQIDADRYTPSDAEGIPTGELRSVQGSPFDLRQGKTIGPLLQSATPEIRQFGGFDHNFVLNAPNGERPVASAWSARSGIRLEVSTSQPALQFYTANSAVAPLNPHGSFCMEAQAYPDAPNRPNFPSTILRPGEVYRQFIVYRLLSDR